MRRKPITSSTQMTVAEALTRLFISDRENEFKSPNDRVTLPEICAAIQQCGIAPENFAMGCAIELFGCDRESQLVDEVDAALASNIGDVYASRFISEVSKLRRRKTLIDATRLAGE